jgi:hypothetical protein
MQKQVETAVKELNKRKVEYSKQLASLNNSNPEIMRTRKKALTQSINYVDMQIILWNQFYTIENEISGEMSNIQERIDSFLSMIESSAILFREGLNLIKLQRDINEALALFNNDIPKMEQLTKDMEASWDNLDYLVDTLISI